MISEEYMEQSMPAKNAWWLKELGGIHWGFLPALFCLYIWVPARSGVPFNLSCMVLLASLMASYDVASRRIPNNLNLITALYGLGLATVTGGLPGLGDALLAGLIAFAIMAVFFFIGAIGAGDVKALGALATLAGMSGVFYLLFLTALAGGVLAVARIAFSGGIRSAMVGGLSEMRKCGENLTLPYGLAVWAGAVALAAMGGGT